MTGIKCPHCGQPTDWGSTTNRYQFVCKPCDDRFDWDGYPMSKDVNWAPKKNARE